MLFFHDEGDDRGIDRARAGAHHKAVQRGQTHGGIHHMAVAQRGNGRTVAQMQGDDLGALAIGFAQQLAAAMADIAMRGAVEAIAAHGVFFIILVRHAEHICIRRHGLVERGVEHHDLRNLGAERGGSRTDTLHMRRIVQRRQRGVAFDIFHNLLVDQHGMVKFRAALHDTVTDRGHFVQAVDDLAFAAQQRVFDDVERGGVVGHRDIAFDDLAVGGFVGEFAVDTDAFAVALCQNRLVLHINQLIFQRGAAGVDD